METGICQRTRSQHQVLCRVTSAVPPAWRAGSPLAHGHPSLAKRTSLMVRVVTWKVHHHWLHGVAIELGILGQDLFVDITQVLHKSLIPCSLSVPSSSSA
jgi:hypothetical protein